jgi:hypothetical protein
MLEYFVDDFELRQIKNPACFLYFAWSMTRFSLTFQIINMDLRIRRSPMRCANEEFSISV